MSRRLVVATFFITVLIGTLGFSSGLQMVEASGTIYIRADGSIDPPAAHVSTIDNVTYILTGNIVIERNNTEWQHGIVIERDNTIVDGAGYTVQGTGASGCKGIDLSSRSNVTIKNMNIEAFNIGIYLDSSSGSKISGNSITTNEWGGIWLESSSNNTISGNHVTDDGWIGIGLGSQSNYNRIVGNVLVNDGLLVDFFSYGNVVVDNLVNGKPLIYLEGVSDVVVKDAGQVILVNCNHIRVENLNLYNTNEAVRLVRTVNSTITGNNVTNNSYGISLEDSSNYNSIVGNTVTNNSESGIRLTQGAQSTYNSIVGNTIANNRIGIDLSSENRIYHNNFINNSAVDTHGYSYPSNVFDDGYPSGGNYWSDYNGTDLSSGQYQNETGSDGIGDSPYIMDANNIDNYPLIVPIGVVGVKTGDWVKYDYTIAGAPSGTLLPQWLKVEFLSVVGTNASVRVTMHRSDGTEQNATVPVDVVAGGQAFGLSGFVVPANLTVGDSVFMSGYGNATIAGETTGSYAGASRTAVNASFSQYGTQLTYYWDELTGVMVEASTTSGTMTGTGKATETNMWQAQPTGFPIDPPVLYALIIVVVVIVAALAFLVIRRRKKPIEAQARETETHD